MEPMHFFRLALVATVEPGSKRGRDSCHDFGGALCNDFHSSMVSGGADFNLDSQLCRAAVFGATALR